MKKILSVSILLTFLLTFPGMLFAAAEGTITQLIHYPISASLGGTGSTTLTGILQGNGTGALNTVTIGTGLLLSGTTLSISGAVSAASSTLLSDNNTFSGIDNFTNSSSNFGGTWQTFSPSHFQTAGTYLTALGNYATTTGTAISLSTSTLSFNGLTLGQTIVPSTNSIVFTPTLSGTLNNAGLANSSLAVNTSGPLGGGGSVSLGGSLTLTCATCNTSSLSGSGFNGMMAAWSGTNALIATSTIVGATFQATSTTVASQLPYASSTAFSASTEGFFGTASSTSLIVSGIQSALHLGGATGVVSAYGGTACTNQFIRSFNGTGVATCNSVSLTSDVSGILPTINGGTATSTGGVTNGVEYYNGTNLTNSASLKWNPSSGSTGVLTFSDPFQIFSTFNGNSLWAYSSSTANNDFFGINAGNATGGYNPGLGFGEDTALGRNALEGITTGYSDMAIGFQALGVDTTGFQDLGIGSSAGATITTGNNDVAIGYTALGVTATSSNDDVGIGSLVLTRQNDVGTSAGTGNSGDALNTAIGYQSARLTSFGYSNTFIGANSGFNDTTGAKNEIIGANNSTNPGPTTGSNNILIGYNQDFTNDASSNQLNIGGLIFGSGMTGSASSPAGNVGIGTTTPNDPFDVASALANGPVATISTTNSGGGLGLYNWSTAAASRNWGLVSNFINFGDFAIIESTAKGGNAFAGAGNAKFYMDTNGNVGIGTSSPQSKLTVNGDIGTDGLPPSVSSCGTGAVLTVGSTDTGGEVTEGTLATGCTLTFATSKARPPFCTASSEAGLSFSFSQSSSALTMTNIGALSSTKVDYICIQNNL